MELNIGAELLWLLRNNCGMPKIYLRGLTQAEEKQEGVDFFAQLSSSARIFAFQFKAPRGQIDTTPYRYTLVAEQHDHLFRLTNNRPGRVFYVLPFYVITRKLQQDVPNLMLDTWLLDVRNMQTNSVFGGQKTKAIRCEPGRAQVNPEYELHKLAEINHYKPKGIPANEFALWYSLHRNASEKLRERINPWLFRGFRVAVLEPDQTS